MTSAVLCGAGAYLPSRRVTNDELAETLDTSDEWVRSRTGIATRHWVGPGQSTGDLATRAGELALKSADSGDVDAVVLATTTPDRLCPGTAPDVASRLGLSGVAAWDVSAVCTGFLYGLASAAGLIATGAADRVLLVAAEAFSALTDPDDRSTRVIFGDGAGAVVLRAGDADEPGAIGPTVLGSDGSLAHLITVPGGGVRDRVDGVDTRPEDRWFRMLGGKVYKHAVDRMTGSSSEALRRAGWVASDVDRFAAHQANARICASVAERLSVAPDACLTNIEHVGNTAAASIPVLLAQAGAAGDLEPGHRVLVSAFGGGATWGATTLRWPEITPLWEIGSQERIHPTTTED